MAPGLRVKRREAAAHQLVPGFSGKECPHRFPHASVSAPARRHRNILQLVRDFACPQEPTMDSLPLVAREFERQQILVL